ncbi:MAG: hypothetical protein NUV82_01710 [Candidatus Komeilibacteria bacterium]|nr:hypothetical protein [Candidatus Komeilibacteria bacterium]
MKEVLASIPGLVTSILSYFIKGALPEVAQSDPLEDMEGRLEKVVLGGVSKVVIELPDKSLFVFSKQLGKLRADFKFEKHWGYDQKKQMLYSLATQFPDIRFDSVIYVSGSDEVWKMPWAAPDVGESKEHEYELQGNHGVYDDDSEPVIPGDVFVPENRRKECPACEKMLSPEDINEMRCGSCLSDVYNCPRCHEFIAVNPDILDECVSCQRTYRYDSCPNCCTSIYADSSQCGHCNTKLELTKCPECTSNIFINGDKDCPACGSALYVCPRCKKYITQDPEDGGTCPNCLKSLNPDSCPKCDEDMYEDEEKCSKCGTEVKRTPCPSCGDSVIIDGDKECPECNADLYLCKRSDHYLEEDLTYETKCPTCSKALVEVSCPVCDGLIWADATDCPHCEAGLLKAPCPNEDCGKLIIIDKDTNSCPWCESDIEYTLCPHCKVGHYKED